MLVPHSSSAKHSKGQSPSSTEHSKDSSTEYLKGQGPSKSIFSSTTFWSIVLLLLQAIGPSIERAIAKGNMGVSDYWAIFQAIITALSGIVARCNVGDLYTPRGMPGTDPPSRTQYVQEDVRSRIPSPMVAPIPMQVQSMVPTAPPEVQNQSDHLSRGGNLSRFVDGTPRNRQ